MIKEFFDSKIQRFRPFLPPVSTCGFIPINSDGFWKFRSAPTKSLHQAAEIFNRNQGETIIEIGTGLHGRMAGNSILVWTGKTRAKRIIAIDLDPQRIEDVKGVANQHPHVELVVGDGITFLQAFPSRIDLLYLDFTAPEPEGQITGTGIAEAYRLAYHGAKDKLNPHSMILIDDTDHIHPWKHTLIVPDARKDGYRVLYTGRQTLLIR